MAELAPLSRAPSLFKIDRNKSTRNRVGAERRRSNTMMSAGFSAP
jgi:hypothetical protein